MTLKHAQAELKTKQAEVKKMDSGYKKDQDALQAVRSSREKLQAELAKLNYEGTVCTQTRESTLYCSNDNCYFPCYNFVIIFGFYFCVQMGRRRVC